MQNKSSGTSDCVQQSNRSMNRNVGRGSKRAKDSKKSSVGKTGTVNLLKQDSPRFNDTIPYMVPFGYKPAAPFDDSLSKKWILNS